MPIYIFKNKNVHSLITHYSHANILSKKRPFSQKHCALMSIKKNHEKSPSVMPIFDQKTSILSKQHYIMSQRSQYDALFFRFLTKKSSLLCPHFVKKRPFSKKTHCSQVYILSKKRPCSQRHCVAMSFFQNFHEKPPAVKTIFGQKTSILQGCSITKFW